MYSVELSTDSEKFLRSCNSRMRERFVGKLLKLEESPRSQGKKLVGEFHGLYRMKIYYNGVAYRAIYDVDDRTVRVLVLLIDKREQVYEKTKKKKIAKK